MPAPFSMEIAHLYSISSPFHLPGMFATCNSPEDSYVAMGSHFVADVVVVGCGRGGPSLPEQAAFSGEGRMHRLG